MSERNPGVKGANSPDPQDADGLQQAGFGSESTDYVIEVDEELVPLSAASPYQAGQMFDQFELVRVAGRGSVGDVWQAEDTKLDCYRAVKILHPSLAANPEVVEAFFEQARAQARLQHTNILQVYSVGRQGGAPFYVAEWVDGESLDQRIVADGPLPPIVAWDVLRQVVSGLAYALEHNVVHRDLHPGNLLLETARKDVSDRRARVKIKDFGLAAILDAPAQGKAAVLPGSKPEYTAPEIVTGMEVDHRSDIYSLGILLYHMLAGFPPFQGAKRGEVLFKQVHDPLPALPPQVREAIGAEGLAVLTRMTQKRPDLRYRTYEELLETISASPIAEQERRRLSAAAAAAAAAGLSSPAAAAAAEPVGANAAGPAATVTAVRPVTAPVAGAPAQPPRSNSSKLLVVVVAAIVVVLAGGAYLWLTGRPAVATEPMALSDQEVPAAPAVPDGSEAAGETEEEPAEEESEIEPAPAPLTTVLSETPAATAEPAAAAPAAMPDTSTASAVAAGKDPTLSPAGAAVPAASQLGESQWSAMVPDKPVTGVGEIVVDNANPGALQLTPPSPGMWRLASVPGSHAYSALVGLVDNTVKTATFVVDVPQGGTYDLYLYWVPDDPALRSNRVLCTVHSAQGPLQGTIDQTGPKGKGDFYSIGRYELKPGKAQPLVTLSTEGSEPAPDRMVSVDALKLVFLGGGSGAGNQVVEAPPQEPAPAMVAGAIVVESGMGGKNREQYRELSGKWIDSRTPAPAAKSVAAGVSPADKCPGRKYVFSTIGTDTANRALAEARFYPGIEVPGRFHVYTTWPHGGNVTPVHYVVQHAGGVTTRTLTQDGYGPGPGTANNGSVWIRLGEFDFTPGTEQYVAMQVPPGARPVHTTANGQAYADAVCFSPAAIPDAQEDDRTSTRSTFAKLQKMAPAPGPANGN